MKHLVLLGTGLVHVHVLMQLVALTRQGFLPFKASLIAPHPEYFHRGLLADLVTGDVADTQCRIDLRPWLQASGANYICGRVTATEAERKVVRVQIANGNTTELPYDMLGADTEPGQDRQMFESAMPGAREHALFLHPIGSFLPLWAKLLELAQTRALRVAIVGNGADGCELAMAVKARLPHCAVTLVGTGSGLMHGSPAPLRQRVLARLRAQGVTVLPMPCTRIEGGHLLLGDSTRLACDAPLLADAGQAGHAMRSAPARAADLLAAVQHLPLQTRKPGHPLEFLTCGRRNAIASLGNWSAQGRWVWWFKRWSDQRLMASLRP